MCWPISDMGVKIPPRAGMMGTVLLWASLFLTALLLGILGMGCSSPPEQLAVPARDLPKIIQDGISIPRFSTAEDQLNYARSGLTDQERKRAALRAVPALFSRQPPRVRPGRHGTGLSSPGTGIPVCQPP